MNPTDLGEWELNSMNLFGDKLSRCLLLISFAGISTTSHSIQTGFFPLSWPQVLAERSLVSF